MSDIDWDATVSTLSGGQRRRVQLARLLVGEWDVIALDEPTNHLDIEGITWLAEHLQQRWARNSGGLLVVTHDRWFLDEVATTTWEVHDGIVEPFEGGYAAYVLQRVERDRQAAAAEAKRQNLMRKELAWLRRGPPARTSKPKFRIDAANRLIADVPPLRNTVELAKLATARLGKDVVDLLDVSVSFDERPVLRDIEWRIAPGERTGIVGANGAGKSTLLGLIAGTVQPDTGRVKRGKTVRLAVLDQQGDLLTPFADDRIADVLAGLRGGYQVEGDEVTPAQLLERLGFGRGQLSDRVSELSGGQRRRLQLMLTLLSEPNVLLLDEPTNDVDTDMLTATEDLLDSWPGTLIVVSHDRYLLERITDQQYAILDGRLRHLPGGIDEYLRLAADSAPTERSPRAATRRRPRQCRARSAARPRKSSPRSTVSSRGWPNGSRPSTPNSPSMISPTTSASPADGRITYSRGRSRRLGGALARTLGGAGMSTYQPVRYMPGEALLSLYRRRGPVINSGLGPRGYTYLLGAEANEFVFANADAFSWRETFENLAIVDGPTALIVSDGADHQRRRSVIAPGLRHREIQSYVQTMASAVDTVIDGWRPGQRLDIYQQFRSAVRRSTAESLFGHAHRRPLRISRCTTAAPAGSHP